MPGKSISRSMRPRGGWGIEGIAVAIRVELLKIMRAKLIFLFLDTKCTIFHVLD